MENKMAPSALKIMLIDDDISSLQSLYNALRLNGYPTQKFENPTDALKSYENGTFDVVATDYKMPDMTGVDVLKAIKKINPEAYVIVFTGYADGNNIKGAYDNGAYAFIRKPLDWESFIAILVTIEKELEKKHQTLN
jgi:DNA-binding NtrC family response regulator